MSPLRSTPGEIMLDQELRSGSPRLHPFFETGPAAVPATASSLGWSDSRTSPSRAGTDLSVNAPWNSGRRYSSADLVLRGVKARAGVDGAASEQQEAGQANQEGKGNNNQRRQSQTIPALLVSTVPKSPSPLSSNSVIAQVPGESDSGCTDEASMPVSRRTAPMIVSSHCSPTDCAASSASSVASHCPSDDASSTLSDETADTEATSPGRSPDGDETPIARVPADLEKTFKRASRREPPRGRRRTRASTGPPEALGRYGTPEMPRGTAKFPHIPATAGLTPRVPGHQGHFVKHLPRAEKLPMSGYELLASTISSCSPSSTYTAAAAPPAATTPSRLSAFVGSQRLASRRSSVASFVTTSASSVRSGSEEVETAGLLGGGDASSLKPIYRRFEALNHRMLLHLQDELSELEEQLHRLDTTDTQTRRLPSRILPASRRAEHLAGGELQSQKADVLGKIGSKLGQYNHVLSSFAATRDLPAPSASDVHEYRSYLATHQPITEVETRFIDTADDLVTLAAPAPSDKGQEHNNEVEASSSSAPAAAAGTAPAKLAPSSSVAQQEEFDTFPMPQPRGESEDAVPPFPSVTPIPGTMHGNSWLQARHHRLSPSSGSVTSPRGRHSRTQSHPDVGLLPQAAHRRASMTSFQLQQQQKRQRHMSHAPFAQQPPPWSSLGQQEEEEDDMVTMMMVATTAASHQNSPRHRSRPETLGTEEPATIAEHPKMEEQQLLQEDDDSMPVNKSNTSTTSNSSGAREAHGTLHIVIATAVAVLVPILAFSAVPGFAGRISVVLLVGLSAMGSMVQSGVVVSRKKSGGRRGGESSADLVGIAAVYAAVMAVVAVVVG